LTTRNVVVIANRDTDLGLLPADQARAEARVIANEEGKPLTLRDPVTERCWAL
jgi:hypothetical protein